MPQPVVVRGDRAAGRTVLAVAAGRPQRGHLGELVEHHEVVDVAAVQDAVDAVERAEGLRPQLGAGLGDVGVGDQPHAHAAAVGEHGPVRLQHDALGDVRGHRRGQRGHGGTLIPAPPDRRARAHGWQHRARSIRGGTMGKRDVSIPTPDGTMDAGLHIPDGQGPWPGVIMYPDAGGVRPTFDEMAERLAALGYVVLVPNFYYRLGEVAPFDMNTVFSDEGERKRLMTLVGSVSKEDSTKDTTAMLDFLAAQPEVADTKVGTTGYCMGGGFALNAAGRFPDRIGAAASFHGGQIASTAPDSPHLLAGAMQATVYIAGAENDASFDDEQFERLSKALTEADVDHTLVTY